jgi:hypothetical protein
MPNTPLQTFRTVEPANYAFGSSATLASQPFVLYHQRGTELTTSGSSQTLAYPSFTGAALGTRFQPWTVRDQNNHYPVVIPNAYDRVFVYPMYVMDTINGATGATGATTPVSVEYSIAVPGNSFTAGFIMPFGLFPDSRLNPNTRNAGHRRLPWDLIREANPSATITPNPLTSGCWTALPAYASNFTTSNGLATAAGTFAAPVSTPRTTRTTTSGTGAAYQFPPDLSTGLTCSGSALTNATGQYAATTNSMVFNGAGLEFSTMGCEELVVSLVKEPENLPAVTVSAMTVSGTGAANGKIAMNFFLMGVFLG